MDVLKHVIVRIPIIRMIVMLKMADVATVNQAGLELDVTRLVQVFSKFNIQESVESDWQ